MRRPGGKPGQKGSLMMHDDDYCIGCKEPLLEDEAMPLCDDCIRLLQWDEYIDHEGCPCDEAPNV